MAMKNTDYLKSLDLLPSTYSERVVSTFGFGMMWVGMAIVISGFAIGGAGMANLSLFWVLAASIVGCVLIGLFMTITSDVGIEHGLSFPVYIRAPFGTVGTHIPALIRAVTASMWFGINTYFGATAVNAIFNIFWGFDNWFLCFVLFIAVQLTNTILGIKAIERFANLAAPTVIIIAMWMYVILGKEAAAMDRNVWACIEEPVSGGLMFTEFMLIVTGTMGYWSTLANDLMNISRYVTAPKFERGWWKRNKGMWVGSIIVMPIVQTLVVAIGAIAYIAVGDYDPVAAIQLLSTSGIVLAILFLMIVFAQWSTNTPANVVPAATVFSNVGGPKVPYALGVVIAGVIAIVSRPWAILDVIIPFLIISGAILSATVGIIIVDYYIIRKRRLNVPDLYESNGQYRYLNGINWAGMISFVIGGGVALLFQTYSFFVGCFIAGIVYYFLAKYWWFKKYKQAELEDPSDEKYLGITVGREWKIDVSPTEKDDSEASKSNV